jgi:hypothetical protein
MLAVADGSGVVMAGVVMAGVVMAGVVMAGVVMAGVVMAGVVMAGVVMAGVVAEGVVEGICALVGALPAARFCPGSCCWGTTNHCGGFTPKTPGTSSPSASIANADHNIWRFSIWRGRNIDSDQPLTTIDVLSQNLPYISAARTSRTSGM